MDVAHENAMDLPAYKSISLEELCVVFRFDRQNRNSFLALLSALEVFPELDSLEVSWASPSHGRPVDQTAEALFKGRAKKIVLCYSIMTHQWPLFEEEIQALASHPSRCDIFILAGGPHAFASPKRTLQAGCDAICVGDGEEVFPRFILSQISQGSIEDIPGLYIKKGGKPFFTGRKRNGNGFSWDRIPALPFRHRRFGPFEITRGCPYGCRYCQTPVIKGRKVRHRSIDSIFEAVERMVDAGRPYLRFITPNALAYGSPDGRRMNLDALTLLLSGMRKRLPPGGRILFGSFPSEVRPEFVTDESAELIRSFCNNGSVVLGAQSGNANMLQRMRRGHDCGSVRRACRILRDKGLEPIVDFILGLPGETIDQMLDTLSFMEELAKMGARLHVHTFSPLPGSPWAGLRPEPISDMVRIRLADLDSESRLYKL